MANLAKTARDLSSQIAPVLAGSLAAVNEASDFANASQVEHFKDVIKLALKCKEAGLTSEQFAALADVFKMTHKVATGGSIEFAASVASGLETTEGKTFSLKMGASGAIAGFGLTAEGGFGSDSRKSSYERSQQNLQIRIDWATVPSTQADALVDQLGKKVLERGFALDIPVLKEESQSPLLKALESYLPVLKEMFAKKPDPQ